jgi:hypothetical protein
MDSEQKCIFRFTTHGQPWSLETPCDLRLGANEALYQNGDPRIKGFDLRKVDFFKAFHLAFENAFGEALPWDKEVQ